MFFKINKCIFIGVKMKAFTIQSKNKIGAWAHMRPPLFRFLRIYLLISKDLKKNIVCSMDNVLGDL